MENHHNKPKYLTPKYLTLSEQQKAARRNRAFGILIAVLLFAVLIYIATYAKFGG